MVTMVTFFFQNTMYIMCNNYDDVILLGNINYPGQGGYVYAYVFASLGYLSAG